MKEHLHRLEDHDLLRGGLTVFELDAVRFKQRADQFAQLFALPYEQVTGALLAKSHDGRSITRSSGYMLAYLGAPKQTEPWADLFRARKGENPHPSTASLMGLLDDMADGKTPESVIKEFCDRPDTPKDWRYYMAKYPKMRCGESGRHVISPAPGYLACMLRRDSCDDRSYHYDPYLMALVEKVEVKSVDIIANSDWPCCFPGYELQSDQETNQKTNPRFLELKHCGVSIQCAAEGWKLKLSDRIDSTNHNQFKKIVEEFKLSDEAGLYVYRVPQKDGVDTEDRIELGAKLLRKLVKAPSD